MTIQLKVNTENLFFFYWTLPSLHSFPHFHRSDVAAAWVASAGLTSLQHGSRLQVWRRYSMGRICRSYVAAAWVASAGLTSLQHNYNMIPFRPIVGAPRHLICRFTTDFAPYETNWLVASAGRCSLSRICRSFGLVPDVAVRPPVEYTSRLLACSPVHQYPLHCSKYPRVKKISR